MPIRDDSSFGLARATFTPPTARLGARIATRWLGRLKALALAVLITAPVALLLVRGTAAAALHFGLPGDPDRAGSGAAWALGLLIVVACLAVPACCVLAGCTTVRRRATRPELQRTDGEQSNAFLWALALGRRADAAAAEHARQKQALIDFDDAPVRADTTAHPWYGPCARCAASNDLSFGRFQAAVPFESHGHESVHG